MELLPVKSAGAGRKTRYRLEARDLSCKLVSTGFYGIVRRSFSNGGAKFILRDVSCEAGPGEVTAVAGPSGAGKTTLLEILAGKVSPRAVSGHVLVNGKAMDAKRFRRLSGYVTQEDALFPSLTVQETLMYSARLRLRVGAGEAARRVGELMRELGLDRVASSRIGEGSGISGGERRRVSIGVELVHDPAVILIDEPTSGLDSASAMHVVSLLKSMALRQGKTVVVTIHQPGFRILELIDRVVLLSDGRVAHSGSMELLEERLRLAGHGIPKHVNALEFAIDVITDTLVVQTLAKDQSTAAKLESGTRLSNPSRGLDEKPVLYANSRMGEVRILGKRFCRNVFRTRQLFATRVIQALSAGLILGTVFLNSDEDLGPTGLQTRIGFFAFSLTFLLSSTTEGLPIFLQERRILMRETSRGAYRVSSYILSNALVFMPFLLAIGFLFTTPVYWLVGLRRDADGFLYYSMIVWLVLLMSNSFVACFSALVPNFIMGNSVISGFMGSFFLFSGYFIAEKNIPRYWLFMHYMSLFKYPFECFMINEYGGEQGRRRCVQADAQGQCTLFGDGFLAQQGLVESQKWSNLGVMLGFIFGYRVISFLILWLRCYKFRT
uniref:ABC transporter domain-containing protein n=1 Tax=Kalanchoe fedtschenkoi TaxID=63787 RepID=A0A7N0VDV4_KALFE